MPKRRIGAGSKRGRRRPVLWALGTIAPWCAALAMVVSYAADAGQEARLDASQSLRLAAAPMPSNLVPIMDFGFALPPHDAVLRQARLVIGEGEALAADPDDAQPNPALKPHATAPPAVDRTHKGDPTVSLRPTFDAKLRTPGSLARGTRDAVVFADDDPAAQPMGLTATDGAPAPGPDSVARFEPMPHGLTLTTAQSSAAASPNQRGGATTPHMQDGSTPGVARAASLASTTPAASDATPIEIGALPKFTRGPRGVATGNRTLVGVEPAHPDYAALIGAAKGASEQRCLATAIYFEARSEPEEGQAAVAQVILNRVASGLYPTSVCGVVFQNQQRHNACQFSFACEGHALRITEPESWATAVRVAHEVTDGTAYVSDVGGATHYHANYVRPLWASRLTKMDKIGHHIFYKLKPGQT